MIAVLLLLAAPAWAGDYDRADTLGRAIVDTGYATEYRVGVRTLNLTISSLLPGDARAIATAMCQAGAQQGLAGWRVRVFLPVGDRPAAACGVQ